MIYPVIKRTPNYKHLHSAKQTVDVDVCAVKYSTLHGTLKPPTQPTK